MAFAGGFLLAQQCDLVVAAEHATFAITEAMVGCGAPWAAPLSWLLPPRIALLILLTGDPISAHRPLDAGLVERACAVFCWVVTQRRHHDETVLAIRGSAAHEWMAHRASVRGPPDGTKEGAVGMTTPDPHSAVRIANCSRSLRRTDRRGARNGRGRTHRRAHRGLSG